MNRNGIGVGFLFLLIFSVGQWSTVLAQFSTAGFDTVIIEKKDPDDFIYWFGEPYDFQYRMIRYGFRSPSSDFWNSYETCRWQFLSGQNDGMLIVDFRAIVERGVGLTQGLSYLIPNYENLHDPPAATPAPVAVPTYIEPAYNGRSGFRLERKSPVKIFSNKGDTITTTLFTKPEFDQPFRGIINRARRAGETDLPVLGHAVYDPTLRDVGLEVYASSQKYVLLCSGAQRRAWVFRDDLLLAMFQYDLDHLPAIAAPAYHFRIEPYMFIRPGLPLKDQRQIPFLLMLARASVEMVKDKRFF